MESAARQARALVAAAEAEADRIRSSAFDEGFAAGREEARAELAPSIAAIGAALAAVRALEADVAERVESQAVDLAVEVAERVVAGAIEVDPARVLDVVRGALRTMVERERVTVLVHPSDVAFVRDALPDFEVHDERRVARGGAIIRTSLGEVDATLETKLDRAREAMLTELARES
jgi:flagellar biosynthesis/type III secretory pathway protein FliH